MKKNVFIIAAIGIVALIAAVLFLVKRPAIMKSTKRPAQAAVKAPAKAVTGPAAAQKKAPAVPQKKAISKDKGAVTVKLSTWDNKPSNARIRAFKINDSRSSTYVSTFLANRISELPPGTYDIEVDTTPQKIYKNIKVNLGQETTEDLGCLTGLVRISALNSQGKPASYPVRVFYAKSDILVTMLATNRPSPEILPGHYDLEIGTVPKQFKRDVKIEAGKETVIDMGKVTGILNVSAVDDKSAPVRVRINIKKADGNEIVSSGSSNTPIELVEGTYTVEVFSKPAQTHKDVKIKAGEETKVLTVITPQAK